MKKETIENGLVLVPRDVWNNHITRDEFEAYDDDRTYMTNGLDFSGIDEDTLREYKDEYVPILYMINGVIDKVFILGLEQSVSILTPDDSSINTKSREITIPNQISIVGGVGLKNETMEMFSIVSNNKTPIDGLIESLLKVKQLLRFQEIGLFGDVNKLVVTDLDGVPVKEYNSPVLINNFKSFLLTDASFPTMLTDRTRNIFLIKKLYQSGGIKIEDGVMYYSTVQTDQSAVDYVENNIIIKFNEV